MAKIKKLGSVYFDDGPVLPGSKLGEQQFSIGDTYSGMELQWVCDGCRLVADRCVCINISREQLNQMGFVHGSPVTIDGKAYLCRCLVTGNKEDIRNEWDAQLNKYGNSNDLWHWKNQYFWGQESALDWPTLQCVVRGYMEANYWSHAESTIRDVGIGFRPVLEPLFTELSETLVGSKIKVFGPHGEAAVGCLVGFGDYDLVLSPGLELFTNCNWATRHGQKIVVNKEAIIGIGESPY